jgi:hypothetical protein
VEELAETKRFVDQQHSLFLTKNIFKKANEAPKEKAPTKVQTSPVVENNNTASLFSDNRKESSKSLSLFGEEPVKDIEVKKRDSPQQKSKQSVSLFGDSTEKTESKSDPLSFFDDIKPKETSKPSTPTTISSPSLKEKEPLAIEKSEPKKIAPQVAEEKIIEKKETVKESPKPEPVKEVSKATPKKASTSPAPSLFDDVVVPPTKQNEGDNKIASKVNKTPVSLFGDEPVQPTKTDSTPKASESASSIFEDTLSAVKPTTPKATTTTEKKEEKPAASANSNGFSDIFGDPLASKKSKEAAEKKAPPPSIFDDPLEKKAKPAAKKKPPPPSIFD